MTDPTDRIEQIKQDWAALEAERDQARKQADFWRLEWRWSIAATIEQAERITELEAENQRLRDATDELADDCQRYHTENVHLRDQIVELSRPIPVQPSLPWPFSFVGMGPVPTLDLRTGRLVFPTVVLDLEPPATGAGEET